MKKILALLLVAALAAVPARAVLFTAILDGPQEVPPVASPGTGYAELSVDLGTGAWTLTGSFADLIGTTTAAHIHIAPPGVAGPVVAPLTVSLGVSSGTLSGAGLFVPGHLTALGLGDLYINVHTTFKPGGEIRGQLTPAVPDGGATLGMLGLGLALAAAAARNRSRAN